MISRMILAGVMLALGSGAATAQALVDGTSIDEIANIARGYGSVSVETASSGNPMISGKIDGVSYYLFFRNCSEAHTDCEDINFYAGFLDNKQSLDAINAWNRDNRYLKAFHTAAEIPTATVQYDVVVLSGEGVAQLADPLTVWLQLLPKFAAGMGYVPPR